MAAVTPINLTAYGFTTPAGPKTATTEVPAGHMEVCYVACGLSGTYATGTGFSITSAQLISAINLSKRDGQTIVIWDVASAAAGVEGAAFVMPGQVTFASTAGPATGLMYGPDLATEHAVAVMGSFASPVVFAVTFSATAAL